jgi:hypothetical protein
MLQFSHIVKILVPADVSTDTIVYSPDLVSYFGLTLNIVRTCEARLVGIKTSAGVEVPANGETVTLLESGATIKVKVLEGSTDFATLAEGHIYVAVEGGLRAMTGTSAAA